MSWREKCLNMITTSFLLYPVDGHNLDFNIHFSFYSDNTYEPRSNIKDTEVFQEYAKVSYTY